MSAIVGYNVKAKEKQDMKDVVIDRNGNRCFAKGVSVVDGQRMSVAMSLANAEAAIKNKTATKGSGW